MSPMRDTNWSNRSFVISRRFENIFHLIASVDVVDFSKQVSHFSKVSIPSVGHQAEQNRLLMK